MVPTAHGMSPPLNMNLVNPLIGTFMSKKWTGRENFVFVNNFTSLLPFTRKL
jgi:hypothetical protein